MELTITLLGSTISTATLIASTSTSCVIVPGWSVIVVATLLTAPRLVSELRPVSKG